MIAIMSISLSNPLAELRFSVLFFLFFLFFLFMMLFAMMQFRALRIVNLYLLVCRTLRGVIRMRRRRHFITLLVTSSFIDSIHAIMQIFKNLRRWKTITNEPSKIWRGNTPLHREIKTNWEKNWGWCYYGVTNTNRCSFLQNNDFNPSHIACKTIYLGALGYIAVKDERGLCWCISSGYLLGYEEYTVSLKVWPFSVLAWPARFSMALSFQDAQARITRGYDPLVGDIEFA